MKPAPADHSVIRPRVEEGVCSESLAIQPVLESYVDGKNKSSRQTLARVIGIGFLVIPGDTEGLLVEQEHLTFSETL